MTIDIRHELDVTIVETVSEERIEELKELEDVDSLQDLVDKTEEEFRKDMEKEFEAPEDKPVESTVNVNVFIPEDQEIPEGL